MWKCIRRKKGNQWYHGIKAHIGIDAETGFVHTVTATAANVHDSDKASKLFREDDQYGDAAYIGLGKSPELRNDPHLSSMVFWINKRPSSSKVTGKNYNGFNWDRYIESRKFSVRCKVEHPFLIVKRLFGYSKV